MNRRSHIYKKRSYTNIEDREEEEEETKKKKT